MSESIHCDWILPNFRHNKKDVINCMHETKTNSPVINDILECVYSHDLQLKPTYANYNAFKKALEPYMKKYEEFRDNCKWALKEGVQYLIKIFDKIKIYQTKIKCIK